MFNNPFLNSYGMGQQYQPPMQPMPAMPAMGQQVIRVNGENGARAYQMGANSSALLLDESGTIVWLVTSDGAGYKTVAPYDIAPHKTEPPKDWNDLESRIRKLEEMIGGESYDPRHSAAAGREPDGTD